MKINKKIFLLFSLISFCFTCPFQQKQNEKTCSAISLLCEIFLYYENKPIALQEHNSFLESKETEINTMCETINMIGGLTCNLKKSGTIANYLLNPAYYQTLPITTGPYYSLDNFVTFVNKRLIPFLRFIDSNNFLAFNSVLSIFVKKLFKIPLTSSITLDDCLKKYCIVGLKIGTKEHFVYSLNPTISTQKEVILFDQQNNCVNVIHIPLNSITSTCHYSKKTIEVKEIRSFK